MSTQVYREIQLAEGERLVRDYHAGVQKRPKVNIFLAVTTRRLLAVGETKKIGGKSILMAESYLQDVSGINALYGGGIQIVTLIAGIIFFLIGIGLIHAGATEYYSAFGFVYYIGIIFFLVGIGLIVSAVLGRGRVLVINVFSRAALGIPISIGVTSTKHGPSPGAMGWGKRVYVKPGPDAEKMIKELSAFIMDLQSEPESALKKWGITTVSSS
ncbi:MAG: hypothetical protein ACP5UZ_08530 [Thermoplasmata archaeon]